MGELDAFIKVPRPDGEDDRVGTLALDEPAAHQSDRTILEMQLRATSKKQHKDMAVVSMEKARLLHISVYIQSIFSLYSVYSSMFSVKISRSH